MNEWGFIGQDIFVGIGKSGQKNDLKKARFRHTPYVCVLVGTNKG